jgi:hypothetical protein
MTDLPQASDVYAPTLTIVAPSRNARLQTLKIVNYQGRQFYWRVFSEIDSRLSFPRVDGQTTQRRQLLARR